jgi:hypothetical protein
MSSSVKELFRPAESCKIEQTWLHSWHDSDWRPRCDPNAQLAQQQTTKKQRSDIFKILQKKLDI